MFAKASPRARSRRRRGARADRGGARRPDAFFAATRCGWRGSSAWSSSSSGREHLRSSDNLDESGNFQLRREPLTAMANSGAVSPRPDIEGGRTASSTGRGNEVCPRRDRRGLPRAAVCSWGPARPRGARPRLKINLVSYLWCSARAAARALAIARSTTEDMITTRGWTWANLGGFI